MCWNYVTALSIVAGFKYDNLGKIHRLTGHSNNSEDLGYHRIQREHDPGSGSAFI